LEGKKQRRHVGTDGFCSRWINGAVIAVEQWHGNCLWWSNGGVAGQGGAGAAIVPNVELILLGILMTCSFVMEK